MSKKQRAESKDQRGKSKKQEGRMKEAIRRKVKIKKARRPLYLVV
jgi:hypothetical protein